MTTLYLSPAATMVQQFTNVGVPLAGGLLYVYQAGTTSTQTSYTDATGTTANANPITLVSGGRLPAGTSIWVAANTPHKIVITDASGNQLLGGSAFDNLYGINDPTSVQNLLLPPTGVTTGTGVDLVANAVKSYATFATLRAFGAPSPIYTGQTLIAYMQGGSSVQDGLGGAFYWSATSSAADDGVNTIKPTGVIGNGRWLRIGQGGWQIIASQAVLCVLTGMTATVNITVEYQLEQWVSPGYTSGNYLYSSGTFQRATLNVGVNNGASGTSNATSMTITGLPSILTPTSGATPIMMVPCTDNSSAVATSYVTWASGVPTFYKQPFGAGWTNSGTKGVPQFTWTYAVT